MESAYITEFCEVSPSYADGYLRLTVCGDFDLLNVQEAKKLRKALKAFIKESENGNS